MHLIKDENGNVILTEVIIIMTTSMDMSTAAAATVTVRETAQMKW